MKIDWLALLRYGLVAAGGFLSARGYLSEGETETVVGALLSILTTVIRVVSITPSDNVGKSDSPDQ